MIITTLSGHVGSKYYLNSITVGANGNNRVQAEVQLVQFFLYHFYQGEPAYAGIPLPTRSGPGFLIDGLVGPQTVAGIRSFQEFQRKIGHKTVENGNGSVDVAIVPIANRRNGKVNVVPTPTGYVTTTSGGVADLITHSVISGARPNYTIIGLNDFFFNYQGNTIRNRQYLGRLYTHPLIAQRAPALYAELARLERS